MGIGNYFSEEKIIEGLRTKKAEVLDFIYINYYPVVESIIVNRYYGSAEDAKDIFQDALISVYTSLCADPPLVIRYKFITFLSTICRRRMIDKIRTSKNHVSLDLIGELEMDSDVEMTITLNNRKQLIEKYFGELGEKCRMIISLFLNGYSISEIAIKLNQSNTQMIKNQRLKCKKELFEKIYNDPILKELSDGKPWNLRKIPEW